MKLDERKKAILEAVVKEYVRTAEPIGSRAIVKKRNLGVSPATVRNEMADLEEMGFLEQPHTSSGRIPSENGFRYFVDYMMVKEQFTPEEEEYLRNMLSQKIEDISTVIRRTGNVLAQFTNYASVVITPPMSAGKLLHLQLVPVGHRQALVVMVTDLGNVIHRRIEVPESIEAQDLEDLSRLFTKNLQGAHFDSIGRTVLNSLRRELLHRRQFIEKVLEAIEMTMGNDENERVFINGALNIVNQPEFKDFEKLRRLLLALEEHELIKSLVSETGLREVKIKIGTENEAEEIKELSVVFTTYVVDGNEKGRIGLIGPVRMEYWKASASVEKVRDIVQEIIHDMSR
ncbi:MAG: heat-inducible transcription repressor HrcA [Syntrophomonadaceae bacterium]|jgi:heat-inducible transcriptional repressor|nr:heat-inducible transcription repressor HrcA [Syntrophomonadaceae bacterium]